MNWKTQQNRSGYSPRRKTTMPISRRMIVTTNDLVHEISRLRAVIARVCLLDSVHDVRTFIEREGLGLNEVSNGKAGD